MHALAIQLISLLPVTLLLLLLRQYGGLEFGIGIAAILQGLAAVAITYLRRMPSWWLPFQLLSPPAAVLVLALQLPSWVFLAAFVVLLGMFWATLFTRVPLYLSSAAIRQSVAELLPKDRPVNFVDVGSGLGGVVINLASRRPDCRFTGIELAPVPWLISRIRAGLQRGQCRFIRGDYAKLDLANYDVVFAYLSPVVMDELWRKAKAEMRPGALLLSCEFPISGVEPDLVLHPNPGRAILYGWKI